MRRSGSDCLGLTAAFTDLPLGGKRYGCGVSEHKQRAAFPKWRSERGCDSPVPSLCRCLCLRPRRRQRCTWVPLTAQLETRSGRRSRSSSLSYRPCWCNSRSPSSTGTWAGTDPWSCCCTSCSSDPSSGQLAVVYLRGEHTQPAAQSSVRTCCRSLVICLLCKHVSRACA